jgi:altronate hydrolase
MVANVIRIRPNDNVAIARVKLQPGDEALGVRVKDTIDPLHKIALQRIRAGSPVMRYGEPIGLASKDIEPGQWIHTHNLSFHYTGRDYQYSTKKNLLPAKPEGMTHFSGYRRENGEAATRNYIAVISSVNCSGHVPGLVVDKFRDIKKLFPNVDGVLPFTHQTGCGITMNNEAHASLSRTFAGMMKHPNIIGCIMVGLGCEQLNPTAIVESGLVQIRDLTVQGGAGKPVPTNDDGSLLVSVQSHGGTENVVREITGYVEKMLPRANAVKRVPIGVEELILAMNCGGSDAFSGLTANPAVGYTADLLAALGATAVLAETPETAGAEHILTERAVNRDVGEKLVSLIRWWENYFAAHTFLHPQPSIDNNPSHGNKAGGLTTIVEKSLGAVAKGGTSTLNHVLEYAQKIPARAGLCFMDTPGKDSASMTGLVAGGANIGVFTTGRGNVAGWAPVPTIKICTNTATYDRLSGDMDLNAGVIMDGTASVEDMGLAILSKIIAVASGELTRSEILGANTSCFDPWYFGPSV